MQFSNWKITFYLHILIGIIFVDHFNYNLKDFKWLMNMMTNNVCSDKRLNFGQPF